MKKLLSILALVLLTACTTPVTTFADKQVHVDSKYLETCALLQDQQLLTPEEALINNLDLITAYALCARKQDDSIKVIKKLANIKE